MQGKGIPDVNVRLMIRKLREALLIPVFALMDADPYGLYLYLNFFKLSSSHRKEISELKIIL